MKSKSFQIKYAMYLLFGAGLFAIYQLTKMPMSIIQTQKYELRSYDTTAELLLQFVNMLSITASVCFLVLGAAGILKYLISR